MKTRKLMAMAMAGAMALPTCTAFADSAEEPVKLTGLFISHSLTKSVNDMQWLQEIEDIFFFDLSSLCKVVLKV